ncbi:hypothetical protein K239x_46060 [Planctomycetes bacterium K23_9]|uniref:Uncharacterized protein n=2 Tax=Stieleria marina TaxID=1930275 RepID=A0A517NZP5_9BACT|nr:hypothetical protein K239x_46060 [Planctomycetes bacterium K23_9]
MKRFAATIVLALVAAVFSSDTASAQQPCGFGGFQPFGFYQPYGARYGSSLATPPYFALNPPVYYGARFARPYGMSPFASPPIVTAPAGYQGRLRTNFQQTSLQHSARVSHSNPYVSKSAQFASAVVRKGDIQSNPFASDAQLAQK